MHHPQAFPVKHVIITLVTRLSFSQITQTTKKVSKLLSFFRHNPLSIRGHGADLWYVLHAGSRIQANNKCNRRANLMSSCLLPGIFQWAFNSY